MNAYDMVQIAANLQLQDFLSQKPFFLQIAIAVTFLSVIAAGVLFGLAFAGHSIGLVFPVFLVLGIASNFVVGTLKENTEAVQRAAYAQEAQARCTPALEALADGRLSSLPDLTLERLIDTCSLKAVQTAVQDPRSAATMVMAYTQQADRPRGEKVHLIFSLVSKSS